MQYTEYILMEDGLLMLIAVIQIFQIIIMVMPETDIV